MYRYTLSSIGKEDSKLIIPIFQWLTFSERPLSVEEIAGAVAIDQASNTKIQLEDILRVLVAYPNLFTITSGKAKGAENPFQETVFLSHDELWQYLVSEIH